MSDRLQRLRELPSRDVVGLNVGTSQDGIDAAWVRFEGAGFGDPFRVLAYRHHELPTRLRARLAHLENWNVADLCEANADLGEAVADAVQELIRARDGARPDLIGSHGATIWHRPPRRSGEQGATLQIGDLAVISERVGVPVIGDFRTADMAAGGQGAPLTAFLDHVLYRQRPGTCAVNLGGIANLTLVGEQSEDLVAFDTGPANLPLDYVMRKLSRDRFHYDPEGRNAAAGRIDDFLLQKLLAHPFILRPPPKTTGREEFGAAFVEKLLQEQQHLKLVDILATLTAFSARALRFSVNEWLGDRPVREVVVSGGGVKNLTLMEHIRRAFFPIPVSVFDEAGATADAKEALLFALLAHERLFGRPGNVPAATGAKWPVGLGKIVY